MKPTKFDQEREIVDRFLRLLGCSNFSLHDPNVSQGSETGADVSAVLDGKRYGIEVTLLHSDEGSSSTQRGSELRHQEAKFKNSTVSYAAWGNPNPMPALRYRIEEKCKKSYPESDFDEVVLLVVSGLPQMGAITSTLLFEPFLDLSNMNSELSPVLEASRYGSAYLFNMMGVGGESAYEWQRQIGWKKRPRA
jgi:hypothetical protein